MYELTIQNPYDRSNLDECQEVLQVLNLHLSEWYTKQCSTQTKPNLLGKTLCMAKKNDETYG